MGYCTASTEWPSGVSVPAPVKQLVDTFFSLVDDKSSEVGNKLADEVFAVDGIMQTAQRFEGSDALRKCRDSAWVTVDSRRHEVLKVYASDEEGSDLLLIGQAATGFKNGKKVTMEFAARIIVEGSSTEKPKIKLYQVWADSAPMVKAMQA